MKLFITALSVVAAALVAITIGSSSVGATNNSPSCIDGSNRYNLKVVWTGYTTVNVKTKNGAPVCKDTPLYFSSYTAPDNYDGKGFAGNPTATPQTIFDSTSFIIKQGTTESGSQTITAPAACKNAQTDVYYGPEVKNVGPEGHVNNIFGKLYTKTEATCTPVTPEIPPTPETPSPVTPEVPAPTVVDVPAPVEAVPAELPTTGSKLQNAIALGSVLSAATYAGAYAFTKRR